MGRKINGAGQGRLQFELSRMRTNPEGECLPDGGNLLPNCASACIAGLFRLQSCTIVFPRKIEGKDGSTHPLC
jgi:hypothetical protein